MLKSLDFKLKIEKLLVLLQNMNKYNHYTNFLVLVKFHNTMYDYIVITLYKV